MKKFYIVRYVGGRGSDPYYGHDQTYPVAIKRRLFSKKVTLYKRRGYRDQMDPGSDRTFRDMYTLQKLFKIIEEDY